MTPHDDDLLTPREAAQVFNIRTATLALWTRIGRLTPQRTLGGHARYRRTDLQTLLDQDTAQHDPVAAQRESDAVRLYEQGWSIRRVAEEFDTTYGAMRRLLRRNTTLRNRAGTRFTPTSPPPNKRG